MNIKNILNGITLALALCFMPSIKAADWGELATIWSATSLTNIPASITNLNAASDCKYVTEVCLNVDVSCTNNSGGWLDLHFAAGNDTTNPRTNFCDSPITAIIHPAAFVISIPLTNTSTRTFWTTNIQVGSFRYLVCDIITNNSTCHFTNVNIRTYGKIR